MRDRQGAEVAGSIGVRGEGRFEPCDGLLEVFDPGDRVSRVVSSNASTRQRLGDRAIVPRVAWGVAGESLRNGDRLGEVAHGLIDPARLGLDAGQTTQAERKQRLELIGRRALRCRQAAPSRDRLFVAPP